MAECGVVGASGSLVIDGHGRILRRNGIIPDDATEGGEWLSPAIWMLNGSELTLADAIQSAQAEGVAQVQFRSGRRAMTLLVGVQEHQLRFEPDLERIEGPDATFRDAPVGMYRRALDGRFVAVNTALAVLFGYDTPKAMLRATNDIASCWYVNVFRFTEFLERIRAEGVIRDFQSQVWRADGTVFWVAESVRTIEATEGSPLCFEGIVVDVSHHKAAERELRDSRETFRRLVESVHVVPWEADASGQIRYIGPQAEQLLGFSMGDWLAPGFWASRIHPHDRDWVMIVRDDAIRSLGRFECEYRLLDSDGKAVWVRDITGVLDDERTGEKRLGGFLHDITHRRAAEEALRESQNFIEQIANASPLIWYVLDLVSGKVIYLNGGGLRALGFAAEAMLKMEPSFFVELGHPMEGEEYLQYLERLTGLQKGSFLNREFRLRTAEETWAWMRSHDAAFKIGADGRVEQIVGTAKDITLQKAALENLARSEALFRSLAETTNVIPFELELAPVRFTYIGPQAAAFLGYRTEDWLREEFWGEVVHPEDRSTVELSFSGLMTNPDSDVELEFRIRDAQGAYRWVRQVLRSEIKSASLWIGRGFILDISTAKSIEAEREVSRKQLRELALENQRVREEERLAMSRELHDELGQALTLLRIDLTWVASRIARAWADETSAALQEKLREMESEIGETLQTLRRITTRLRPPILDELGLADAIEWQVRDFSRRVGIRCEVSAQSSRDECKTRNTVVFRVLQELLTNVARHSKASRVRVFLEQLPATLTLTVSDNGCGFDPGVTGRRTGLGLLGIQERAESLRGNLQIQSRPGNGTTVVLRLPTNGSTLSESSN